MWHNTGKNSKYIQLKTAWINFFKCIFRVYIDVNFYFIWISIYSFSVTRLLHLLRWPAVSRNNDTGQTVDMAQSGNYDC